MPKNNKNKNELVILGIGKFSINLINRLIDTKMHVIAIDHEEKIVADIASDVDVAIRGDSTSVKFLVDNGIHKIDRIVLGMGTNVQASLLTATNLIELGATNIYAKATTDTHEKILRQIGVKNIVKPESVAARKMATQLLNPIYDENITDFEVEIYNDELSIAKLNLVNSKFINTKIQDLGLPLEKISIILISRKGKTILPYGGLNLIDGDRINLLGEHEVIYTWASRFSKDDAK